MSNPWDSIDEQTAQNLIDQMPKALDEVLIPFVKKWMYENQDTVEHHLELGWCEHCEDFQGMETDVINGKVGHIDDWVPDEYVRHCDACGRMME